MRDLLTRGKVFTKFGGGHFTILSQRLQLNKKVVTNLSVNSLRALHQKNKMTKFIPSRVWFRLHKEKFGIYLIIALPDSNSFISRIDILCKGMAKSLLLFQLFSADKK